MPCSALLCLLLSLNTGGVLFSFLQVKLGNFEHEVKPTSSHIYLYVLILLPIVVGVIIGEYNSISSARGLLKAVAVAHKCTETGLGLSQCSGVVPSSQEGTLKSGVVGRPF